MKKITNLKFNSKSIWLSEDQNEDYLTARIVICDFTTNRNGVMLNRGTIGDWISTLVSAPLVGKLKAKPNGEIDFTSHNANVVTRIDENGNEIFDLEFDTDAFGTFTSVDIEMIDGVECIVATAKIWKRFYDASNLIVRRINEGTLSTSWEIAIEQAEKKIINGAIVKVINKGRFIGHALLSSAVQPAYPISRVLEVAEKDEDEELYSALIRDAMNLGADGSEGLEMEEEKIVDTAKEIAEEVVATDEPAVDNPETDTEAESAEAEPTLEIEVDTEEPELSALTDNDLRDLLYRAIDAKLDRKAYTFMVFPEAHEVWAKRWDSKETEMFKFTYTVDGDSVTVSEPEPVVLIVAPRNINSAMDEKNAALIDAQKQINELTAQVAALEPYREAAEQAEREKAEAQHKEAVAQLKQYARESGMLSEDELDAGEIAQMIEELKETEVKVLIADRIVGKQKPVEVETSDAKEQPGIYTDLSATSGDTSYSVFRSKVFGK